MFIFRCSHENLRYFIQSIEPRYFIFVCPFFDRAFAGAGWNIARRVHVPSRSVTAAAAAGPRAAPLHAASTTRGGGAASSPLRMVATEPPVLKPTRCVAAIGPAFRQRRLVLPWGGCVAVGGEQTTSSLPVAVGLVEEKRRPF